MSATKEDKSDEIKMETWFPAFDKKFNPFCFDAYLQYNPISFKEKLLFERYIQYSIISFNGELKREDATYLIPNLNTGQSEWKIKLDNDSNYLNNGHCKLLVRINQWGLLFFYFFSFIFFFFFPFSLFFFFECLFYKLSILFCFSLQKKKRICLME